MSTWINEKCFMKHYLKKKNFIATQMRKILHMQITCMRKVYKDFEIKTFGEHYHLYLKSKYMKGYDKNNESSYLKYWM